VWLLLHRHNTDKQAEVPSWDLIRVARDVIDVPRRVGELRKGAYSRGRGGRRERERGRQNGERTDLRISELLNRDVKLGGVLSPVPPPGSPVLLAPLLGSPVLGCVER
jgi:hypothetical protein